MSENTQAIFQQLTQGVYIISVRHQQQSNAFTAAWVMQVSFDPLMLCFSINPTHHSYSILKQGGVCCVSVLNNQQYSIAEHFGHSGVADKMSPYTWLETETAAPALQESLAYFDCRVDHYCAAGDHQLVVCHVIDAVRLNQGIPMLYRETANMDHSRELYKK